MKLSSQYIAGFFDGEGCVTFQNQKQLRLSIAQLSKPVLFEIQKVYGGCISGHNLTLVKRESQLKFINDIYPYAIVKQKQLELALKFLALLPPKYDGMNRWGYSVDTTVMKNERLKIVAEIKKAKCGYSSIGRAQPCQG